MSLILFVLLPLHEANELHVSECFTPWQLILSTLTGVYALRNLDKILGLDGAFQLHLCILLLI